MEDPPNSLLPASSQKDKKQLITKLTRQKKKRLKISISLCRTSAGCFSAGLIRLSLISVKAEGSSFLVLFVCFVLFLVWKSEGH